MSRATIDRATGSLRLAGQKVFPLGLSNPPPVGGTTPAGRGAFQELADGGASFIRTGRGNWDPRAARRSSSPTERAQLDAAAAHGLHCWLYLGDVPDLPARLSRTSRRRHATQMLSSDRDALKDHPGLGAYKGVDEPRNPFRGANWIRPEGLVRALQQAEGARPEPPARDHPGAAAARSPS